MFFDERQISFLWNRHFLFVHGDFNESSDNYVGASVNPADFESAETFKKLNVIYLRMLSADKQKKVEVAFCDENAAVRIWKAISYLKKFYTATKPLPF